MQDFHILNIVTVITVMKPTRVQTLFLYLQRMKKRRQQENFEADRLAKLIEGIVASGINVYDSDENIYRPAEYRDIVILTRSVTGWADTFADALMDRGYRRIQIRQQDISACVRYR